MNHLLEDLHRLTAVPAPSGRERAIAALVRESWRRFGDVKEDRLGNLSVTVGEGEPHVAYVAHLDEVGFAIRLIDDDGFIGLNRVGGIPERVLAGQRILLPGRDGPVAGVFGTYPHHFTPDAEKYKVKPIGDSWVDVDARSRTEATDTLGLRVGDFGVYERSWHLCGDTLFANALDDRVGIAALTAMLEALHPPSAKGRVSLIASVQEEFSIRALVPTVRRLDPDALVVVDISPATDTPDIKGHSDIRLGEGPVMHLHSFHGRGTLGGVLPPKWLVEATEKAAAAKAMPLQRASVVGVITDGAFALHLNDGVPTIEIGVPVRYTHCPVEACSMRDLERLIDLLGAMAGAIPAALQSR
jgi:putative aminopeptidase FrvX